MDYGRAHHDFIEYVTVVNKSYRHRGAVGKLAIIPRLVAKMASINDKILDFGSGTHASHVYALRAMGFNVDAWEIGFNWRFGVHTNNPEPRGYNWVYLSNVLNVQPDVGKIEIVIDTASKYMAEKSIFIANYPKKPRYGGIEEDVLHAILSNKFGGRVNKINVRGTPVFYCWGVEE